MDNNEFKEYLFTIKKLINTGDIVIKFFRDSANFMTKHDIEKTLLEIDEELDLDNLKKVIDYCIPALKNLALGNKEALESLENDKTELINEILLDKDYLDEINVGITSRHNLLEEAETYINTKRSETNPKEILTYSAEISLYTRKSNESDSSAFTIELTEKEIDSIINMLEETKNELNIIKGEDT